MATKRPNAKPKGVKPRPGIPKVITIVSSDGQIELTPELLENMKDAFVATFRAAGVDPALIKAFKKAPFSPVGPPWQHMDKVDGARLKEALQRFHRRVAKADQGQLGRDVVQLLNRKYSHLSTMDVCQVLANILLPNSLAAFEDEEHWRFFWVQLIQNIQVPRELSIRLGRKVPVVKETVH